MEDTITTGIDFMTKIQSGHYVLLKFTKKDGSTRIMKATLNFDLIPKEKKPKEANSEKIMKDLEKNKILRIFDLEKIDWRTVPFEQVDWVQTYDKDNKTIRYKVDTKKILKI